MRPTALRGDFSSGKMVAIVGGRTDTRRNRGEARPYPIFPPAVHCSRTPIASASAANSEPAINRGILRTDMLEVVGVLGRNVTRVRLAIATGALPINRVSCVSDGSAVGLACLADDLALPICCAIA